MRQVMFAVELEQCKRSLLSALAAAKALQFAELDEEFVERFGSFGSGPGGASRGDLTDSASDATSDTDGSVFASFAQVHGSAWCLVAMQALCMQ